MSRKQKIIVSITGIVLVSLILIGLTYAYFLTKITGNTNDKSISVSTANLQIVYGDNSAEILGKDLVLEPSSNEIGTKTFTVTNNGNSKTSYVVVIENVSVTKGETTTTFESNDFRYTLDCVKKDGSNCDGVSTQTAFPINGGILVSNSIDVSDVQTYTFKMWYIDTGVDQSNDMGKTLQAKINITNIESINPYSSNKNSLAYNIIESAKNKTNGTELLAVPKVKPGEGISEYKTGKIIKETVTTSSLCSSFYPWLIGDSESAAQSGITVSSYDDAVGKYVYDQCDGWTKKLLSYDSTTNILTFVADEYKPESTLSIAQDDYGTTYYFRGNPTDNYVNYAGMCWRIVRIEGDGSIKLILASEKSCSADNLTTSSGYATDGATGVQGTKLTAHYGYKNLDGKYINDYINSAADTTGNARTKLNAWLERKITNESDKALLKNETWCIGDLKNGYSYSDTGEIVGTVSDLITTGTSFKYTAGNKYYVTKTPSYKCETTGVEGETDTNKVGMLTFDEIVYAGGGNISNSNYYLNNNATTSYWWALSPSLFLGDSARSFTVNNYGYVYSYDYVNYSYALRVAVSLKSSTIISAGSGLISDPYTVG